MGNVMATPGKWLEDKVRECGKNRRTVIGKASITYKTLRSYIKGDTTPLIRASQWLNLAQVLNVSSEELVNIFKVEGGGAGLPPMNANHLQCLSQRLDMPLAELLERLGAQ